MKLKEIFKAIQDEVKLEFQYKGDWYTLVDVEGLPRVPLNYQEDISNIRIAKQYATIDGKRYEKLVVCKKLDYQQEYYFEGI